MRAVDFIHDLTWAEIPQPVIEQARHCALDLLGVAAGGLQTELSRIVHNFAARQMASSETGARILFDGRRVSPAGAAYAGASTIDAIDAHDGHALTKGHAGVAVLPALLALADSGHRLTGREFLTCLVLGYEIATRAGIALHSSAADYHTSGAWNALGCAAIAARLLALDRSATRHALGIAEYHGPRSQMMRVIDHPTMLKDGSGWGAFAGVCAAFLASDGFTGAPAITFEGAQQAPLWEDLGQRWRILEQYFKPYPICRWAQPAVDAARALLAHYAFDYRSIASIRVATFAAAVRLGTRPPATTEEAQYAMGFPLAAFLVHQRLGADQVIGHALHDPKVLAMLPRIVLEEDTGMTLRFPAERIATVTITLADGQTLVSAPTMASGDALTPFSDGEMAAKFHMFASCLPARRRKAIEKAVAALGGADDALPEFLDLVLGNLEKDVPASRPAFADLA